NPGLGIDLKRAPAVGVSHQLLYHLHVFPIRHQQAGKAVPNDFDELQINVRRSIYLNVIGHCKTEASRKPVPMDPIVASELWSWKQDSPYRQSDDWLFASSRK